MCILVYLTLFLTIIQARINLARALYKPASVYLLDDPLSAVDARVSRHIFEKCIKKHLQGHLRILVTHQLQYLPQADHIVVFTNVSPYYTTTLMINKCLNSEIKYLRLF